MYPCLSSSLDENTLALDKLRADNKRLRSARASSSFVPATTTGASRPDLACFGRPELESALRTLDTEIQGLIEIGDEATVNLDMAKRWAGDQATSKRCLAETAPRCRYKKHSSGTLSGTL